MRGVFLSPVRTNIPKVPQKTKRGGASQSYFGLGQQSSGQTQQLSLSHREGPSSLPHLSVQPT